MAYSESVKRRKTREVGVGPLVIGGENPIWVQSMTATHTEDIEGTVSQIHELEEAGCELVRVTVPRLKALENVTTIRQKIGIPLICDIHFDYRMALGCLDESCEKIRINPGNIGGPDRYKQVVKKAKNQGIPMRIGVNAGSLERDLVEKYGWPCPEALVESALRHIETAESLGYDQMVVSLKSSHVPTALESYRLFSEQSDYPTHIGITEAGMVPYGITKSAVGLGAILLGGIGDTIRVSLLTERKSDEVDAAFDMLQATTRRVRKPEVIACPTCGRLEIDLQKVVTEVEERLKNQDLPLKISILGCIVNGPGEAREADIGIAAGRGKGVIFKKGEIIRHVEESEMVDALMDVIDNWDEETETGTAAPGDLLPVIQTPQ
ncbi:MAG: flavodoxin-dependent (E)-4-hydroxy-3-methylbut-2-enyl-diphosphate synthase [Planctomycetota bacterium]|nr:flavodoxin-dependent (E)-4-hydroxy-3-methylbut-2-enyl-diphosphate synthase [Planctomycetota bacterium]MEE2737209.1 flavodoxin-dependent (E)-4-hydroxy-3-methylbut-2-enyl-diphosphate synthase [Planctomycetota bacterium]